jgi:hypothetical protein
LAKASNGEKAVNKRGAQRPVNNLAYPAESEENLHLAAAKLAKMAAKPARIGWRRGGICENVSPRAWLVAIEAEKYQ